MRWGMGELKGHQNRNIAYNIVYFPLSEGLLIIQASSHILKVIKVQEH